ncbi:hypothetical protein FA09DRAFT_326527 [Tilletiopsis washingtonensis]|uniref:Uncharacterized protein n=1 Tax=Tilletiopsis washingtonensis TaxID=58919 RepID=A0A316Z5Z3_9BASI|nr:hypothetical protein FA09DRAFT_326527 [Tilletiopsis washingtonensis]PWN95563.1 hypothetical protein FA09DRAFT_326527 [Tilletiopsis washingtonensis]
MSCLLLTPLLLLLVLLAAAAGKLKPLSSRCSMHSPQHAAASATPMQYQASHFDLQEITNVGIERILCKSSLGNFKINLGSKALHFGFASIPASVCALPQCLVVVQYIPATCCSQANKQNQHSSSSLPLHHNN